MDSDKDAIFVNLEEGVFVIGVVVGATIVEIGVGTRFKIVVGATLVGTGVGMVVGATVVGMGVGMVVGLVRTGVWMDVGVIVDTFVVTTVVGIDVGMVIGTSIVVTVVGHVVIVEGDIGKSSTIEADLCASTIISKVIPAIIMIPRRVVAMTTDSRSRSIFLFHSVVHTHRFQKISFQMMWNFSNIRDSI